MTTELPLAQQCCRTLRGSEHLVDPAQASALLGGLPLALGSGVGSELRRPLGISIVGGLIISQVLTLYTTPVIYLYMARLGTWIKGSKRAAKTPLPPAPPEQAEADAETDTEVEARGGKA